MGSINNLPTEEHREVLFDTERPFPFQRPMEETGQERTLPQKNGFFVKNFRNFCLAYDCLISADVK